MKLRKIEKAWVGGAHAKIFISFKTKYFSMKTKRQKVFKRGSICQFKKNLGIFNFFGNFIFLRFFRQLYEYRTLI